MKEIFEKFLDLIKDTMQEGYENIYYFDGHIWVTNGKICIRAISEPVDYAKNECPKWGKYAIDHFAKYKDTEHLVLFPIVTPVVKKDNCTECEGKGKVETGEEEGKVCDVCGGSGVCECPDCGAEHDCVECHGEGRDKSEIIYGPCSYCNGTGEQDIYESIVIDKYKIKYFYYKLIIENLSNPKYSVFNFPSYYLNTIYFCADNGIDGLVMPTTEEGSRLSA